MLQRVIGNIVVVHVICLADDAGLWLGEKRFPLSDGETERAICDDSSRIASVLLYHAGFIKGKASRGEVWEMMRWGRWSWSFTKSNSKISLAQILRCLWATVRFTQEAASTSTKDSEAINAMSSSSFLGWKYMDFKLKSTHSFVSAHD